MGNIVEQTFKSIRDAKKTREQRDIDELKERVKGCEHILNLQANTIGHLSTALKESSESMLDCGKATKMLAEKISNIVDAVNLLDKKINAMATVIVKGTDVTSEDLQKELSSIKMTAKELRQEIHDLIRETNPYSGENPQD